MLSLDCYALGVFDKTYFKFSRMNLPWYFPAHVSVYTPSNVKWLTSKPWPRIWNVVAEMPLTFEILWKCVHMVYVKGNVIYGINDINAQVHGM